MPEKEKTPHSPLPAILVASIAVAYAGSHLSGTFGEPASTKPYPTFDDFYPFYISQHQEETCRRLHFIGTSILVFMTIMDFRYFLCILPGLLTGVGVCLATRHIEHGLFEFAVMILVYIFTLKSVFGKNIHVYFGLGLLLVGYGCAWVGHFVHEGNNPAALIHPAFSLLGDFKMWYEIVTKARKY